MRDVEITCADSKPATAHDSPAGRVGNVFLNPVDPRIFKGTMIEA